MRAPDSSRQIIDGLLIAFSFWALAVGALLMASWLNLDSTVAGPAQERRRARRNGGDHAPVAPAGSLTFSQRRSQSGPSRAPPTKSNLATATFA